MTCLSQLSYSVPTYMRLSRNQHYREYVKDMFHPIPSLLPSDIMWLIKNCVQLRNKINNFKPSNTTLSCVRNVIVHQGLNYVHTISDDMELSDFGNQQHTYLCHAKELPDNDMIKKEIQTIGAKMAVQGVWMNRWLPVYCFLGFVTMCKNSSKKITLFTIQWLSWRD